MTRKIFYPIALAAIAMLFIMAVFADLNGKWVGVLNIPGGNDLDVSYNFKVDGGKLTGTALTPDGDVPLTNGKTDGTTFSFSISTSGMDIAHTGKFYGDSTTVDLDVNGSKIHSVLKRVEDKK